MRRRFWLLSWLVALALVAAACSSTDDATDGTEEIVEADSTTAVPTTTAPPEELIRSAGDGQPIADFDYSAIDYSVPVEQSALRGNRLHQSFPPPVIDPTLIRSGGQPPDGILPLDRPLFAPIDEITYEIAEAEAVVAVEVDGDARAFPIQMLIWHEIVNTEIGGTPVTVTYCPLCNSAISYDRRFGDLVLDFGTSGELYQSALVMYDRQTDSLWAHFTGQALVGHLAGARLDLIPTQTVSWADWKAANPDGQVLARSSDVPEQYLGLYGTNPYGGYDLEGLDPFGQFFVGDIDRTLAAKARVVGIVDDDGPVAVRYEDLLVEPVIPVTEAGRDLVVLFKPGLASSLDRFELAEGRDVGQTGVFVPVLSDGTPLTFTTNGEVFIDDQTGSEWNILGQAVSGPSAGDELEPVVHTDTFWFAWATYQPGTVIIAL
ncbi:MAG: DUF3179 domain-containing protein [Actinomycetia bacterium]|nr:DUF3179 domain-containing protein [Actinomycetes bacterium]